MAEEMITSGSITIAKVVDGAAGTKGADAITMSITASNGTVLKNNTGSTVLTAHVYKGGIELTSSTTPTLASQGTIKWYKGTSTTACGTGQTLTVNAADVASVQPYTCQLEG